jgi:aspartate-semialdehyde dehydrogenase
VRQLRYCRSRKEKKFRVIGEEMGTKLWNVAIVGVTSAVGQQMIECLEERQFPVGTIRFLASEQSEGEILEFHGKPVPVEELNHESFKGVELALFVAGDKCSREFCPSAVRAGAVCIDGSAAWRMDSQVPLVVPEVNPQAIADYAKKGIIANPASATIQMVVALKPLHHAAIIKRVVVSTYQAVSDGGKMAIEELERQIKALMQGKPAHTSVYPHRIAFNCLPQIDSFLESGYTAEEMRLVEESRKIMGSTMGITATTVQVPIFYGHSESINIETEKKLTVAKARELLAKAPGVSLADEPASNLYPMAIDAVGEDLVVVGRIREDESISNGLNLWVVADNLRKGAATNAVQIAEILVEKYLQK